MGYKASAIEFSSDGAKIMHSECFFESCSSDYGPAVNIEYCECSVVQHRFCSHKCSAYYGGHHSFSRLNVYSSRSLIYVCESSACECGNSRGSSLLSHYFGKVRVSSTNMSKNIGKDKTALRIYSPNFEILDFSTIESNNASNNGIIGFYGRLTYKIEKCNILKNFQKSTDEGVIFVYGELTLNGCSILGDLGNGKIFYIDEPSESRVTIKNCFYDNLTSYDDVPITIDNCWKTSKYNTLNLYYYAYLCDLYPMWFNEMKNNIKCSMRECFCRNGFF